MSKTQGYMQTKKTEWMWTQPVATFSESWPGIYLQRYTRKRRKHCVNAQFSLIKKKTPKNSSFLLGFSCFLTLQAPSLNTAVKCNSTNSSLNNEQSKATALCLKAWLRSWFHVKLHTFSITKSFHGTFKIVFSFKCGEVVTGTLQ